MSRPRTGALVCPGCESPTFRPGTRRRPGSASRPRDARRPLAGLSALACSAPTRPLRAGPSSRHDGAVGRRVPRRLRRRHDGGSDHRDAGRGPPDWHPDDAYRLVRRRALRRVTDGRTTRDGHRGGCRAGRRCRPAAVSPPRAPGPGVLVRHADGDGHRSDSAVRPSRGASGECRSRPNAPLSRPVATAQSGAWLRAGGPASARRVRLPPLLPLSGRGGARSGRDGRQTTLSGGTGTLAGRAGCLVRREHLLSQSARERGADAPPGRPRTDTGPDVRRSGGSKPSPVSASKPAVSFIRRSQRAREKLLRVRGIPRWEAIPRGRATRFRTSLR